MMVLGKWGYKSLFHVTDFSYSHLDRKGSMDNGRKHF